MTSSIASHRGIQHLPASIKLIAVSKQVSAAMREAYAVEFGILAKVASKPANRLNCKIYQILPGTY